MTLSGGVIKAPVTPRPASTAEGVLPKGQVVSSFVSPPKAGPSPKLGATKAGHVGTVARLAGMAKIGTMVRANTPVKAWTAPRLGMVGLSGGVVKSPVAVKAPAVKPGTGFVRPKSPSKAGIGTPARPNTPPLGVPARILPVMNSKPAMAKNASSQPGELIKSLLQRM